MLNVPRLSCVWSVLVCLLAVLAAPSAKAQSTALTNQLSRIDLSVDALAVLNGNGSGVPPSGPVNETVHLKTSNTVGVLLTVRYTKSAWLGFEGNYGYARYTENFSPLGNPTNGGQATGGIQTNASEYTLGYVAHIPTHYSFHPFVSAGLGTIAFRPTNLGGQQLNTQARMAYYYSIGAEKSVFSPHFGVRAQLRQVFFKAPDFGQNYLTINHRTSSLEPGIGFYLHF